MPGADGVQLGMGEGCCAMPCEEARTKATVASAGPQAFQSRAFEYCVERGNGVQESGRRESKTDRGAIIPHRIRAMRWF